jgi:hypothetical protein
MIDRKIAPHVIEAERNSTCAKHIDHDATEIVRNGKAMAAQTSERHPERGAAGVGPIAIERITPVLHLPAEREIVLAQFRLLD